MNYIFEWLTLDTMIVRAKKVTLCSLVCIIVGGTLILPRQIFAQESSSQLRTELSITPPLAEVVIKPGKSITQAFTVTNDGAVDLSIIPEMVDFSPDSTTGLPVVLPENTNFPYAELQNLDKKFGQPFTLAAGKSEQLVVRVRIPENEQEHDLYKTFLLKSSPLNLQTNGGSTAISQAYVGIHMLISISNSGQDQGKLKIESLKVPYIVDMFSSIPVTLIAKNDGSNYTKAHGEIRIYSMLGSLVKIFPILPENVLSGSVRKLQGSVQDPDDAKSATSTPLEYRPLFLLGRYKVSASLYAEFQQEHVEKTATVWALPISPAIVLALIWLGFRIVRKMRREYENI